MANLKKWFPGVSLPLIPNAPMHGAANGPLAVELTKAGGLGFVPGGIVLSKDSNDLEDLELQLTTAHRLLALDESLEKPIPVGVGFVTFHPSVAQFEETALPIIRKHKPVVIWLFAPEPNSTTHKHLISLLQSAGSSWNLKVLVQVGSVAAARDAIESGADGVVAQGVDAGGHQWAQGASIVSLVPEVRNLIRDEFPGKDVALIAAGGIADGSGVSAALSLGAEAAVMGTRFLVADEAGTSKEMKQVVLSTTDGGSSTVKSYLHDDVRENSIWPKLYDGRAVLGPSIIDERAGISLSDNITKLKDAQASGDKSTNVFWSGTGIGLVNKPQPAGDIVRETRLRAIEQIKELNVFVEDTLTR
ncbi:unnamed protein product [Clonostachys chloroleuca]|uniref:Nitronate monooxygenase domain-containing protein n=1 Tax=Clonostachys chloroleuca TaxID=1926264 RepID=A0AA35Q5S6_9HYPO|nr:unnamed protein product [Clonostachys chloroleuca]